MVRYFEDFAVDEEIFHPRSYAMLPEQLQAFNALTGNSQQRHRDGGIVNGSFVVAVAIALSLPETTLESLVATSACSAIFHRPVHELDVLTVQSLVMARGKGRSNVVVFEHQVRVGGMGAPVCTITRSSVVKRRPKDVQEFNAGIATIPAE